MNEPSEIIVRRKLSDAVFERLKASITKGEWQPGDPVPSERDLMQRFGVGRPAIREAMQALENLGLITISHGERARVRQVTARSLFEQVDVAAKIMLSTTPGSLEHLKGARRFFELGMVREAAIHASDDEVAELRDILALQRASLGKADEFIVADMRFHNAIAAISRNPLFEAVSEALLAWLRVYHTDLLIWSGKENLTLAEHAKIIDCIAIHDADGAEAAMSRHLDRSAALYGYALTPRTSAPKPRRTKIT